MIWDQILRLRSSPQNMWMNFIKDWISHFILNSWIRCILISFGLIINLTILIICKGNFYLCKKIVPKNIWTIITNLFLQVFAYLFESNILKMVKYRQINSILRDFLFHLNFFSSLFFLIIFVQSLLFFFVATELNINRFFFYQLIEK